MVVAGGVAIMYGASIIVDLRKKIVLDTDPIDREEGIKIGVTIKKNHCTPDRNPYLKTDYYAIFGEGIEQHLSTLDNAIKQGILKQGGAWIKDLDDEGKVKEWNGEPLNFQGKEKYRQFVIEHPDYLADLKRRIRGDVEVMSEEEVEAAKKDEMEMAKEAGNAEKEAAAPKKKSSSKKVS